VTRSGIFLRTRREKNHGFHLLKPPHPLQSPIVLAVRQCSVFGGTRMVWYTTNY
jgi:hypothetical protein